MTVISAEDTSDKKSNENCLLFMVEPWKIGCSKEWIMHNLELLEAENGEEFEVWLRVLKRSPRDKTIF